MMPKFFNFFRKNMSPPSTCKDNPGITTKFKVGFSNHQRSWTEEADVVQILTGLLQSLGMNLSATSDWITLSNGLIIQPKLVQLTPNDDDTVSTVTTIEVSHSTVIPPGVFEYQHARESSTGESIAAGFKDWMRLELPVYIDALAITPSTCTSLVITSNASDLQPKTKRRILLGPVMHLTDFVVDENDDHPFCPCCFYMNTKDAFINEFQDTEFHGIRFFSMRNINTIVGADCRINGIDNQAGKDAILQYTSKWSIKGTDIRKQYVVIQNVQDLGR